LATASDKARVQFARISRFGLLEMSRQRLHPSVRETTTETCPRCEGRGTILTVESMALQMLTRMEDLAEKGKKPKLVVQVPSETGEYLMNNKRDNIARIEEMHDMQIELSIRTDLMIPHYRIERHWKDDNQNRLEVLEDTLKGKKPQRVARKLKQMKPVVGIPKPLPERKKKSWLKALWDSLFEKKEEAPKRSNKRPQQRKRKRKPTPKKNQNNQNNQNNQKNNQPKTKVEGNKDGEEGQKRRRRRRRRPNKAKADGQAVKTENKTGDKPAKETKAAA